MLLLELFCGTKSISKVAEKKGIKCVTLDIEKKFNPDICVDILEWDYKNSNLKPDIIWASPVCTSWSIACHKHRTLKEGLKPKTDSAVLGEKLIHKTIEIIKFFKPKYYFIENPRGRLRHFEPMKQFQRKTVFYINYDYDITKPTDIWTNCKKWQPIQKPMRKQTITWAYRKRGKHNMNRNKIPEKLCEEIIDSVL